MATYSMSEARANLSFLLDSVEHGETVEITRHGRRAARLVTPKQSDSRAARMWSDVERIRADLQSATDHDPALAVEYDAEEHVRTIRAGRDAH